MDLVPLRTVITDNQEVAGEVVAEDLLTQAAKVNAWRCGKAHLFSIDSS